MGNLVRVAIQAAYWPRYGLGMGETYESVTVETKDQVAQVTLIGPGKGNAMGPAFWSEMPEVFHALTPTVRCGPSSSPDRARTSATA